ncbi:hypothetical protein TraAM80_05044 [Trypanosoma rangeli]|uniref:Kinesin motor domain-containing protein n=1 Tax=Trypanosoma rangeli TaxID=5698 RepID=A0A3R7LWH4_TRYRA|nr:uncharacterized protein TraAM80_05044 [Trypanosoma rangeli]RNF04710.1 hypothetical protein TraAM80_05044 [Trypanosoma rangeli]|eukprot:RNF04710.1 hypothetical protein TraAM80_05044 [Trypanosoma rangeli]
MDQLSRTPSPTPAFPRRPVVKNILKSVESHVRLMSHLEYTSTSSSYTSLRLKNAQTDTWSEPFNVTRVHRATPTDIFYQEVIAPCVSNCLAGQSYLFLVSAPCESGRSQTLYGSPHHSEKGIIELTAEELLRRVAGTADGDEVGGPRSTVTHSAFIARGSQLLETVSGDPVPVVEFPPPLGATALPQMRLLASAPSAVQIPTKKHMDTSCIVQFQVYTPVDTFGRRSMATLTFVDVAAFRPPHCSEICHLVETVRRVAGLSNAGDPGFKQTKLTTLLESALVGYVTLMSITTISGRQNLHVAACDALRFAESLSRIHQVLMLVHINTPKWFLETAEKLEELRMQRERILSEQHSRGVYDFYRAAAKWLAEHVSDVDGTFDKLLEETEAVRQEVAREVEAQRADLRTRIKEEQQECAAQLEQTRATHAVTTSQLETVKRLDETIAALDQQLAQGDFYSDHKISEMRIEISTLENETNMHRQELTQLEKEEKLYTSKCQEVVGVLGKYAEDLVWAQAYFAHALEMSTIIRKKEKLEAELELASCVARRETQTLRVDRERRSKMSRLTMMQQKVDALRDRVHSNSSMNNEGSNQSEWHDQSASVSPRRRRQRYVSPRYSAM